MSSSRKLGTTKSNASSRRSSFGAASTTSSLTGARKVSNTLEYSSRTGKVSTTTPARPTITAPSTPSVSGPSSSSAAALKRNKHASQRTPTIQTQSSPPDSKPHTASLQWSSTKSRSQLSVGSSCRRRTSTAGSTKITNEVDGYIFELGTDCLTPTLLAEWIRGKGEEFGSIYLIPYSSDGRRSVLSHDGARDSKLSKGSDARQGELIAYRYSIEQSIEAQKRLRYMTLSVYGLNEFHRNSTNGGVGEVRFVTIDEWLREFDLFEKLRQISFFRGFKLTKSFQTWKRVVKRAAFITASQTLTENSCILGTNTRMRDCFLQVQALSGRLTDMGVTEILPRKTYNIREFFDRQHTLIIEFDSNFKNFRDKVCGLVLETCKATFHESGFSYDDYPIELAWTLRTTSAGGGAISRNSGTDKRPRGSVEKSPQQKDGRGSVSSSEGSNISQQQPRKMTFMEQVNKRKVCEKLVSFIRMIDYSLRLVLHKITLNSLIAIKKSLVTRAKSRPTTEEKKRDDSGEKDKSGSKESEQSESEQEIPVFSCLVSVGGEREITITPNLSAFDNGFANFLMKLNDVIQSIPLLYDDQSFHPFTQPILYGKIEAHQFSFETSFLSGHEDECNKILEGIASSMSEAFRVCDLEMAPYYDTAREFCDIDGGSTTAGTAGGGASGGDGTSTDPSTSLARPMVDVETDVDSLKSKLSNLTDQQLLAKGIKDSQIVSLFRADFRPLKRIILPNISKTIVRMQDALPKLGREKMDNFNEDCKVIKEMIEFELKTTEDYVDNMDLAERLEVSFQALKAKLEGIENVYLIMKNIPVPVSAEDNNSLKNLQSQLKAVYVKVQDKIREQADILDRFEETLASEQLFLKETIISLLQEVKSPTLLELDSTIDEVKPALAKIEVMLQQSRSKVLQYNAYEATYGFPISEYYDLVAAEKNLIALKTVWKSTEEWESMYTRWAGTEFSQLHVEELKHGTALIEAELDDAKEVLGDNPMSDDLRDKVEKTKRRIPVLRDLRTEALKERHWKAISEIVGADLSTSSGKKITIEVLDKYSVFDFGPDISRIVRTAALEEQLDCLINELRATWTEQRLQIKEVHGMPMVSDFQGLYGTIESSITTLRELGMSRYSAQMKDDLLKWCGVVEKAERFVEVLKNTQELWLYQEVPLTSMAIQDNHPWTFHYFCLIRKKLLEKMTKLASSESLVAALVNEEDYQQFKDILLALKETQQSLTSALWSLRSDSPRLFFLSDTMLLQMLFQSHNNLPALHGFLDKIFPWFGSLILKEGTDLTVSKKGYHPEIRGVTSKDGETVNFEEVMKARLGVDYWIKCIGFQMRATMRSQSRTFQMDAESTKVEKVVQQWKNTSLSTQCQILVTHGFWCDYLQQKDRKNGVEDFRKAIREMEEFSCKKIKECELKKSDANAEVAKLFLLQYYQDVAKQKSGGADLPTMEEVYDKIAIRYHWLKEQRLFCCESKMQPDPDAMTPYGYEYCAREVLFTPLLVADRVAYSVLSVMSQADICLLKQDVRKSLFRTLANIYGRQMHFVRPDLNQNFKEALVGVIVTNSWLFIEGLEYLQLQMLSNLNFLMTMALKIDNARKFKENFIEVLGKEIDLGSSVNIFLARSNLYSLLCPESEKGMINTGGVERYRQIDLSRPSTAARVKLALLRRGITDNLTSVYLCSLVERIISVFQKDMILQDDDLEEAQKKQDDSPLPMFHSPLVDTLVNGPLYDSYCIEMKMFNAINQSVNTSRAAMVRHFLSLGVAENMENNEGVLKKASLDVDLVELLTKSARMNKEFKTFFQGQKSLTLSQAAATSQVMVENCIKLQKSVTNFPITCVVADTSSVTSKRSLNSMEKFLQQQTGCAVYRICARTQMVDPNFIEQVFECAKQQAGIFHVTGTVQISKIHCLRTIAAEYPTLKVMFACTDLEVLSRIEQDVHCAVLKEDPKFEIFSTILPHLEPPEELVKVADKAFDKYLNPSLKSAIHVLKEMTEEESFLGENLLGMCTINSLCVPLGVFLSKIFDMRKKADLERVEELKMKEIASNEKEDKLASTPLAPEFLLKQKEDYVTCSVQAASILLKDKECVSRFITRFKQTFRKILADGSQCEDPEDYLAHVDDIGPLGVSNLLTINSEVVKPCLGLPDRGLVDFFIPTEEITQIVSLTQFYLSLRISVMLVGEKGCGKSLAFSKVLNSFQKDTTIKYLNMASADTVDFNYEVSLLGEIRDTSKCLIVVENFDIQSIVHMHFVHSLLNGRAIYDEKKAHFKQLPKYVVFVEASFPILPTTINHDDPMDDKTDQEMKLNIPTMLSDQLVPLVLQKSSKDRHTIINGIADSISDDFNEDTRQMFPSVVKFLCSWHDSVQKKFPTMITDHILHRAITGTLAPVPDELANSTKFLRHFYNEIISEYSCFFGQDQVEKELMEFDKTERNGEMFAQPFANDGHQGSLVSFYQPSDTGDQTSAKILSNVDVKLQTMSESVQALMHSYHFIRGKSYNDRLVFSPHFTGQVLSMFRAFSRFGNVTLVGPKGCGKSSIVAFCAHYLNMDLVQCPPNDLEGTRKKIISAYKSANEGTSKLLFVSIKNPARAVSIFELLDKVFYYYDIPYGFTQKEKMNQLFETDSERHEALLDPKRLDESRNDMYFRVKDNLHVVVAMRPEVFEQTYRPYSNLYLKSGTVRMGKWSDDTLIAIAEERFVHAQMEQDVAIGLRNVSKACASLHRQMMSTAIGAEKKISERMKEVTYTQYLDMVKVLPSLYKPLQKKLTMTKNSLQTGIEQVKKANEYINKLASDIAEKEPEILKLKTEIEQLNKRLSQERINLDKASKAFRKKEVAARKKSEETQELAADAHANLQVALPTLETSLQSVQNIDKNDLMEMRTMKNPPEIVQQVMEAVCILLGVKPDWNTAKVMLQDSMLVHKIMEIDKDNLPDYTMKRIRRYIDNPKFNPEEIGKISRASCTFAMWVRAIDLYAKIFKSIEPKRVRLLNAESELADLMKALRAETDRVAHIESTISNIQNSYQERVKRKGNLEISVQQTEDRLARAQMLSYSLEEESERWKQSLIDVDKTLKVLVGNSIIASMLVTYAGCLRQDERRMAVEKWRKICDNFKIQTTVVPATEFLQQNYSPLKSWLGRFEFYSQNYLSLRMSHKWPVLLDPHNLAIEALQLQNDALVTVDMQDDRLLEVLKQAVTKGQEVLVLNFTLDFPETFRAVFERRMLERIHAFVGLMGIPIMRKDFRVTVGEEELICNLKFKLIFHTQRIDSTTKTGDPIEISTLKKIYNVVNFEYSSEALDQKLLRKVMQKADAEFCKQYDESRAIIRQLETAVAERKDGVLEILLKTEEDVLDDKGLVVALKEAKAKVFEILNDLNIEKKNQRNLEANIPAYREMALKMKNFTKLLDLLRESDQSCVLPKTGFIELIDEVNVDASDCPLSQLLSRIIKDADNLILPSLQSKNRYVLQIGSNFIMETKTRIETYSHAETLLEKLFQAPPESFLTELKKAADIYFDPSNDNDPREEKEIRRNIEALYNQDDTVFTEVEKAEQNMIIDLDKKSRSKPLLVFHDESNVINACDIISEMALNGRYKCPHYVSIDADDSFETRIFLGGSKDSQDMTWKKLSPSPKNCMDVAELNTLLANCRKERRWVIVDNFHAVSGGCGNKLRLPQVSDDFRIFFISRHGLMKRCQLYGTIEAISLTHSPKRSVHKQMFQSLLEFTLRPYKKRECIEEYSLSTTLTETDKKSSEQTITAKSEERELIPPPTNFDDRMKNIFEAIVELHLNVCYPLEKANNDEMNHPSNQNNGNWNNHRNLMLLFNKLRNVFLSNETNPDVDSLFFKVKDALASVYDCNDDSEDSLDKSKKKSQDNDESYDDAIDVAIKSIIRQFVQKSNTLLNDTQGFE